MQLREVVETPLLHPERFVTLGIDPPKGVLLYGPPGTGKTLSARAVANRTDACFIRVIGSELVQKYVGEGARMVRELFTMARSKKACIVFFDEVDSIGGSRTGGDENGSDNEVQRTMLQIVTELDGFDARGNIKVSALPRQAKEAQGRCRHGLAHRCRFLFANNVVTSKTQLPVQLASLVAGAHGYKQAGHARPRPAEARKTGPQGRVRAPRP